MEVEEVKVQEMEGIVPPPTDEDFTGMIGFVQPDPAKPDDKKESEAPVVTYNPVWDYLKAKGIDIPEDVATGKAGEKEIELLVNTITGATQQNTDDDEFIKSYRSSDDKDAFIKSYRSVNDIINLPPDDGIRYILQNEKKADGSREYSDEQIEDELAKMSILQKKREWESYQGTLKQKQTETAKASGKPQIPTRELIEKEESRRMKIVDQILEEDAKIEDFGGIPYNEEMKTQFHSDFKGWNKINPETGLPIFNEMLMDNKVLVEVMRAYSLIKEGKIKHHLSDFKEEYKDGVLAKTNLNTTIKGGTTKVVRGNTDADYE